MIFSKARCAGLLRRVTTSPTSAIVRPHQQTFWYRSYSKFRDVFIFDHQFSLDDLVYHELDEFSIKHPNSPHVISQYSQFVHQRPQSSAFQFNFSPAWMLDPLSIPSPVDQNIGVGELGLKCHHSVWMWPDNELFHGFGSTDFENISAIFASSSGAITSNNSGENKSRGSSIAPGTVLLKDGDLAVVLCISAQFTHPQLLEVVDHFKRSCSKYGFRNKVHFIVSTNMRGHRNGTKLMILPHEDCLAFVSLDKIDEMVRCYIQNHSRALPTI